MGRDEALGASAVESARLGLALLGGALLARREERPATA
jgi:hypothetical protein